MMNCDSWSLPFAWFILLTLQRFGNAEAALPGNYDIQRSYKLNITFHYKFPGGLTRNTIAAQTDRFEKLFNTVSSLLGLVSECNGISINREKIVSSPPGVESVFFTVHLKFTASDIVADDQVDSRLTTCIDTLNSTYKGFLDVNAPKITQGGVTKRNYNLSTLSDKESTCGKRIPLPCCAVGATIVSSTRCGCLAGFYFTSGISCNRCPVDTYQDELSEKSCKRCSRGNKTFGKTGMTSASNCSDSNPLKLHITALSNLPFDIQAGTIVVNVTVIPLAKLKQPFKYYIDRVTQRSPSRSSQRRQSRRIRRDDDDDDDDDDEKDECKDTGSVEPHNYFCIHRLNGSIRVSQDFVFVDGKEYTLSIRVTDSGDHGRTENTGSVTFILRDECKEIRRFYHQTATACQKYVGVSLGEILRCPSISCLQPLYNWQMALSTSSGTLRDKCSFDPQNMDTLRQQYSSCIGPPRVTLHPVSLRLTKGATAVLTCNASSSLPVQVTWYKNGQPIQSGNQLGINNLQNEDQGDYYCKFSTELMSSFSNGALLVIEGVLTSIVSFKITNKNYQDDLLDPRSSRYKDFQRIIQGKLENYLNSKDRAESYQVKLVKLREVFFKVGVDLVIYSTTQDKDLKSYYNRLQNLLVDTAEVDKLMKPLKVSRKSVVMKSATHCLPQETGKISIKGEMAWQMTLIGQNSTFVKCTYGPSTFSATRFCGGNFSAGGLWSKPDASSCKYKSDRTNKLDKIAKTRINKQNVAKVTKEVRDLTSQPDGMNEADAVLIADVITGVVSLEDALNETAQDVVTIVDNVMSMKKEELKEGQRSNSASSKFVHALEKLANILPLPDDKSSRRLIASSIAIHSSRADPDSFKGMTLAVKQSAVDPEHLNRNSMVTEQLPVADVQTSIALPEDMFEGHDPSINAVKIGFVIYQNDKFFQPVIPVDDDNDRESSPFMGRIVSSSVRNMNFDNLSKPVELVFEPAQEMDLKYMKAVCVFWDFSSAGGLGNWSDRGCRLINFEAGRAKCHCNHMTNFAVLFSASGPETHEGEHAMALSIISYVGCAISLAGLFLTLITYSMFRNLRKTNQQPILMSLCISLMLLLIVFIAGAGRTENLVGCRIVALLLHYLTLSSMMWMGVEGYNMYMSFVQVMATYQSKFMLKASLVAWGLPVLVVAITVSVATNYYGNEEVCVLYGVPFQAALFGPVLLIIVINFVIFILAVRSLRNIGTLVSAEKKTTSFQRARTSFAILLLLGLTWMFGALAISRAQILFDYLFSVFNSLQGCLIFFFHCLRHREVRNQWKMFLTGRGLLFTTNDTDSRARFPLKIFSKGQNYGDGVPNGSVTSHNPENANNDIVTYFVDHFPPPMKNRPDVVPAEV